MWTRSLIVVACVISSEVATAHGGGLNKDGCHNNRKTGDYHCHRGARPTPVAMSYQQAQLANPPAPAVQSAPFKNCAAARAAGAAPVRRGEPGYGSHLDRDNDGVGCE